MLFFLRKPSGVLWNPQWWLTSFKTGSTRCSEVIALIDWVNLIWMGAAAILFAYSQFTVTISPANRHVSVMRTSRDTSMLTWGCEGQTDAGLGDQGLLMLSSSSPHFGFPSYFPIGVLLGLPFKACWLRPGTTDWKGAFSCIWYDTCTMHCVK